MPREDGEKVYVSEEMARMKAGAESPPAKYSLPGSFGSQQHSRKCSAPGYRLGTSQRFPPARQHSAPGPIYKPVVCAVGRQFLSPHSSPPAFGFGTSSRENQQRRYLSREHALAASRGRDSPAPASYKLQDGVGKQVLSRNASGASFSFSSSSGRWTPATKAAADVPGPGAYLV